MARLTPRERLAQRLCDEGFEVEADCIRGAQGYYRIEQKYDDTTVCREVCAIRPFVRPGVVFHLVSYETMTACARRGIVVGDLDGTLQFIYAKERQ